MCFTSRVPSSWTKQTPILTGWTGSPFEETVLTGHCCRCLSLSYRSKDCKMKNNKKCHHCLEEFSTQRSNNAQSPFYLHIRNCKSYANKSVSNCANCSFDNHHSSISRDCPLYQARIQSITKFVCYDRFKKVSLSRRPLNDDNTLNTQYLTDSSSQIALQ